MKKDPRNCLESVGNAGFSSILKLKRIKRYYEQVIENAKKIAAKAIDHKKFIKKNGLSKQLKLKKAMSLLETSIIIMVIGIFIGGSLALVTFSVNIKKNKSSQQNLSLIYNAIGKFVQKNGRLPCPASLASNKEKDLNYGTESFDQNGNCLTNSGVFNNSGQLVYGAVPTASLGISSSISEDAFGNKISYVIDRRFAKKTTKPISFTNNPSFGAVNVADLTSIISIKKRDYSGSLVDEEPKAIFALISHGANGLGAYPSVSDTPNSPPNNADEQNNYFGNPVGNFDNQIVVSVEDNDQFDDLVIYSNRNFLTDKFGLQYFIACDGAKIIDSNYPQSSVFFGEKVDSTYFCPGTYQKTYMECGTFGIWKAATSCS